ECKDITLSLNESVKVAYYSIMVDQSSSDNCSTVGFFPLSLLSCGDVGTFTQILTIEDPSGNEATCTGTVTIVDEIPPVAVCNDATVSLDEDGNAYLETATIMNEASQDNCSIESYELNREEFSCEDLGTQEIQLTVYDKGGLAGNCIAVVTVIDEIEPKAVCEDVTVSLDGSGNVILDPNLVAGGSTDNCTVASYVLDWDEFGCEDIGTHAVQLTVIDESGQSSSCTASVTVEEGDELPEGFSTASIGPSSGTVTASACDGYYYLESRQTGSYNIKKGWGEFTYVTLDGDFTFTVEVKSMSSNAVAGIMVRDGNGAESIMGFVGKHGYTMTGGVKLDNNSRFIRKGNARGSRTVVLTVTRVGDIITFTQGRSTLLQLSLDLGNSTQVGLFLSSTNNQDAKASFNNVSYSTNNSNAALQIASRNMSPLRGLEGEQPLELKTFPNPSNGQVNIDIKAFIGNAAILKVQNLNRQVVYSENLGMVYQNQQQINLNELESGLYLLTIESAGQLATSKLVIK
ncbi:MAG: T9SS type A sorting domain-containing protein, partial [Bacteroidota bacterium]